MNKKSSIRVMILIPVLLLGAVSIMSNVLSMYSLSRVNKTASVIADEYMSEITMLDTIGQTSKDIHTLALSHIVAPDFDTMTAVIGQIEEEEVVLNQAIEELSKLEDESLAGSSEQMLSHFKEYKESVTILLAQSANQKTKDAYETANVAVSQSAAQLDADIEELITQIKA